MNQGTIRPASMLPGLPPGLLIDEIKSRIKSSGPLTFAEFMDVALYYPDLGYYTSGRTVWGGDGDYITNLDLSNVFSTMLARQLREMWETLGTPEVFDLVEVGAGRGELTRAVVKAVKQGCPVFFKALNVALVEKNKAAVIKDETGEFNFPVFETISQVVKENGRPVSGCIFSHELLDAMPFHRVVKRQGRVYEIFTALDSDGNGGVLTDMEGEPSSKELATYFEYVGVELKEGQVAEVQLAALAWVRGAGELIERGFLMTFDYGHPAPRLFAAGMRGTLLCHRRHTLNEAPYEHIGRQDITCHVDFTGVKNAGLERELLPTGFTTQRLFLLGLDVVTELVDLSDDERAADAENITHNQGIKELIMPGGIGDTMKVFIQHKGLSVEPRLKGFSFKDMKERL